MVVPDISITDMRSVSPKVVLSSPYKKLRLKKMPACTVTNYPSSRPDLFKTEYMPTENGILLSESETSGSEKSSDFFKNYPNSTASSNGSSEKHHHQAIMTGASDIVKSSSPSTSHADTTSVRHHHHHHGNNVINTSSSNKHQEQQRSFSPELHCCERMSDSDDTGSQHPDQPAPPLPVVPSGAGAGSKLSQSDMVLNLLANSSAAASAVGGGGNQQEIYQQILAAFKNNNGGADGPQLPPTAATDPAPKDLSLPNAKRRKLDTNRRSSPISHHHHHRVVPTSEPNATMTMKRKSNINRMRNHHHVTTPPMATEDVRVRSNESFESSSTGGSSFESVRKSAELSRAPIGVDPAAAAYGSLPTAMNPFLMGYGLNPFGFPGAGGAQPHLPLGYPPAAAAPPHLQPVVANPFLAAASNPMIMNQLLWRELLLSSSMYPPMFTPTPMSLFPGAGAVPPVENSVAAAHLMEEQMKVMLQQQMNGAAGVVGCQVAPPPNVNLFQHPPPQAPQLVDSEPEPALLMNRKRRAAAAAQPPQQQHKRAKQQANKPPQPQFHPQQQQQHRPLIHPNMSHDHQHHVATNNHVTMSNTSSQPAPRKHQRSIKSEITTTPTPTPHNNNNEIQHNNSKSSHHRLEMKKFSAPAPAHPIAFPGVGSQQASMGSDDEMDGDKNNDAMTSSNSGENGEKQGGRRSGYKSLTKQRRLVANARERTRVHTIGSAFEELRMQIPSYSCNQKLSKLAILRIACRYIQALSVLSGREEEEPESDQNQSFAQGVDQCTRVLQAESRARSRRKSNKAQIEWEMASYERQRTTTTSSSTTTQSPQHHQQLDDSEPPPPQQQNSEPQQVEIRHQRSKSMEIDVESVDAPTAATTSEDTPQPGPFFLPQSPPDHE